MGVAKGFSEKKNFLAEWFNRCWTSLARWQLSARPGAAHETQLADENQRLIEAVFRELHAQKTHGVRINAAG